MMAEALGADPVNLLRITMSEYMPETWDTIETILSKQPIVSEPELLALKVLRQLTDGADLDYKSPEVKAALVEALKPIVDKEVKLRQTRVTAYDKQHSKGR